uniref:Uncharacterized protein n=1 Tax=Tanacetum cinerariifolium TaxID=118510 RepID=A0A699ICH5_TANCI|nr:hypothetical protein [Tanacetum cinerariifolium]
MNMTIDQQVALDEALVPYVSRLRIGKSNFRLRLDITSRESTLQPEIMTFLRFLGHSGEIKKLTDVNINKLHQPWRSFTIFINKCLSGKSTGYDSLRISHAQIHQVASRAALPKTKASVRKTKSSSDTKITPPTAAGTRLSTSAKGKQPAKASKAKSLTVLSEKSSDEDDDDDQDDDDQDEGNDDDQNEGNDDDQDTNDEGDEFIHPKLTIHEEEETKDEESFDPIVQTPKNSDDEGNDDASLGLNVSSEKGQDREDDEDELYRDININLAGRDVQMTDVHTTQEFEDTHVTLTPIQSDRLRDEGQAENEEFLKNLDENIQKIIKEQVKEQVKVQVSKILPKIEKTVNEKLEADVLTQSSNSSKTSYVVVADLLEMELKKILIENMESNKFIHQSDEQRNLYKDLVKAYKSDKII